MSMDTLLERIWADKISFVDDGNASPISLMLKSLLAAPVVSFVDHSPSTGATPFVCYGGYEILPGASLADVMLEELGVEIDESSVVLFEPKSHLNAVWDSADDLGRTVGRILVDLSAMENVAQPQIGMSRGLVGNEARTSLPRQSAVN